MTKGSVSGAWVNPDTGRVIDAHHAAPRGKAPPPPIAAQGRADAHSDRGVLFGERGFASNWRSRGCTRGAWWFREAEENLTLGALIAARMLRKAPWPCCGVGTKGHAALAREERAEITGGPVAGGGVGPAPVPVTAGDLALDAGDRARLGGAGGRAVANWRKRCLGQWPPCKEPRG